MAAAHVNHIDISDNIPRLQLFYGKDLFTEQKKNQLFPISEAGAKAYGLL